MGLREGMTVLDVGCGVGGPAREMVKFAGVNVVGLNNNDYQIDRATAYASREGLSHKLSFQKGDFMVCDSIPTTLPSPPLTKPKPIANVFSLQYFRRSLCH
jgi:sterol 24-C-methyltransferase